MCLYVNMKENDPVDEQGSPLPKVSDKPIRCLKVARKMHVPGQTPDEPEFVYYMPPIRDYYGFMYEVGKTAEMKGSPGKEPEPIHAVHTPCMAAIYMDMQFEVNMGLHTYRPESQGARFLYDALLEQITRRCSAEQVERGWLGETKWDEAVILECEIPAGVPYYEGITEESRRIDTRGYASEKLKVLRELTPEEVEKLPAPPAYVS